MTKNHKPLNSANSFKIAKNKLRSELSANYMYACKNKLCSTLLLCPLGKTGQVFTDIVHLEVKKKLQFKKLCRGDTYSCKKKKKDVSEIKPKDNILKNKRKCLTEYT